MDILVERHSWEIWKRPASGAEESRSPQTVRALNVEVVLTGSLGWPGQASITTNSEGLASTSFTDEGLLGSPSLAVSAGAVSASLTFDQPGETWTFDHTEATLLAELAAPAGDTEVPAGESRPLVLTVNYLSWDIETSNDSGIRCIPLTITDLHSRYVIGIEADEVSTQV